MPKKIAVITLQGDNYGATLQAVALNNFLNSNGFDAENLNYNDVTRVKNSLSFKQKIINDLWTKVALKLIIGNRKKDKFQVFRQEHLKLSATKWTRKEELLCAELDYDVYVSGSDQIWNPDVMCDDYNYLLAFAPENKKKIAYASSFGKSALPDEKKDVYKKYLSRFDDIAVREKSGVAIISELLGYEPEHVVDPTLLLDAEKWAEITGYTSQNEKYILCYYMPGDAVVCGAIKKIADDLSAKTGYKIINLGLKEYYKFKSGMDCRVDAGPAEFVNLFLGAEYVVTNSFHGTAFSTNFEKKVYVPINKDLDATKARHIRMVDYLKAIGMENSIVLVGADSEVPDVSTIEFDYDKLSLNILNIRKNSAEYLIKAIME